MARSSPRAVARIGAGAATPAIASLLGEGGNVAAVENGLGRSLVAAYFGFFVFLWVYTAFGFERTKPVPARVTSPLA